jgi:hypothetical protein
MCLCNLALFARRGETHSSNNCDNFSTAVHKNAMRPCSRSPPQEIINSLWQLPHYGYDLPCDSQETLSSDSSDSTDSSISAVYGDESSMISIYDEPSISPEDAIELEDSIDCRSITSRTSSTRATRGSLRAMSPLTSDGVSDRATHNMIILQRHRVACQNQKQAKIPSLYPVISSESPTHRLTKKGISKSLPYSSTISPNGRSANSATRSQLQEASRPSTQDPANSQLNESCSCCIGVLSAFEERHLGEEDKQAILHGGCHGLCGPQLSTMANGPGADEVDETGSRSSSPCIKGPYQKRARFIPPMPSSMVAPVRCGTTPAQPRFPRGRVAAQYKQPRQPLPLAERPVRRVRFDSAPLPTQSETRKANEQPITELPSCLKATPAGGTVTPSLKRYNDPTLVQAKQDSKKQNLKAAINQYAQAPGASKQKTDASNNQDKNKLSRGRKL